MSQKTSEFRLVEHPDGPRTVCLSEGVEYYYVDGIDMNPVRLPQDRRALALIAELIDQILEGRNECFSCKELMPRSEGNICDVCSRHAVAFE